jgi:hypothetical protein
MRARKYPCTFEQACHALWAVKVAGWTQTQAALALKVNQGSISRIVHRQRFPNAYAVPIPGQG